MNVRELCRLLSATLHLPGVDRWAAQEYEAERVSIVTLRTAFYERARCVHSDPAPGAAQTPKTEKRTGEPLAAVAGVTA